MIPIADPVAGVDRTFLYIIGFSVAFLTFITALMIYFVFRYRASRHPVPEDIRGNTRLELAWMVIPTLIALSMFYFGWQSYLGLRNVPEGAIEIGVEGEMFAWNFTYPNGKLSRDLLVVPLGKPVKLNISSKDVIHSLSIPAFRIKMDAVKGMQTYVWFMAEKLGDYDILCTEFCGTGHSDMTAGLKIVSADAYRQWLAEVSTETETAADEPMPSTGPHPDFDPARAHHLKDRVEFSWQIDGDRMHVKLSAPTQGWVGIGFNPKSRMMGADFILGMVEKGVVRVTDHFGTGPTKHQKDRELGGRYDLTHIYGQEANGTTEIGFTMLLNSGDPNDTPLTPMGDTTVLLAHGAGPDDFQARHAFRGKFKVNLATGTAQKIRH